MFQSCRSGDVPNQGMLTWQVLGSVCLMLRMSQLAVYHADWLTPLDVHDALDDYVDAPPDHDDVTSPMHFLSRTSKHDSVVG